MNIPVFLYDVRAVLKPVAPLTHTGMPEKPLPAHESCIKVCIKKRKDTAHQSQYEPFLCDILGTAVSSASTCWYPLGRKTSQLQCFVTQPLLTMILVTTIVWGGVGGAWFGCFLVWGCLVFFTFVIKVLPQKAVMLYKNIWISKLHTFSTPTVRLW